MRRARSRRSSRLWAAGRVQRRAKLAPWPSPSPTAADDTRCWKLLLRATGKETGTTGETPWCADLLNHPFLVGHGTGRTGVQESSALPVRVGAKRSWQALGEAHTDEVQDARGTPFQVLL